jgi:hypothetical protein
MFRLQTRNVLRLIVLLSLFAIPAWAQFEVAPDHFDARDKKSLPKVAQKVPKTSAKAAQPATAPAAAAVSASAETAAIRDPQKGAPGTGGNARLNRNLSGNQVAAARWRRNDKERVFAATHNFTAGPPIVK